MITLLIVGLIILAIGALTVTTVDAAHNERWRTVARERRDAHMRS